MIYGVTVGTAVSYDIEVEAESFDQAADKALASVRETESQIADASRGVVPDEVLTEVASRVELIHAR